MYNGDRMNITVDSGLTFNMIREDVVRRHGITIFPCRQKAGHANGVPKLDTIGEVHSTVLHDGKPMFFDGLVMKDLGDDIFGGMPLLAVNDIGVRPSKSQIIIGGSKMIKYDSKGICEPMIRRTSASYVLKSPEHQTVLLPGECLTLLVS